MLSNQHPSCAASFALPPPLPSRHPVIPFYFFTRWSKYHTLDDKLLIYQYVILLACYAYLTRFSLSGNCVPDEEFQWHQALRARQSVASVPYDCATLCYWLIPKVEACAFAGGQDASENCACLAIEAGGSLVLSCAECIEPFNATLAAALTSELVSCAQPDSPTLACSGPCSSLRMALETCYSNSDCLCPFVISDGPTCSQCFATNSAESNAFSEVIAYCASDLNTTAVQPVVTPLHQQGTYYRV
jgi:hypothetical protein